MFVFKGRVKYCANTERPDAQCLYDVWPTCRDFKWMALCHQKLCSYLLIKNFQPKRTLGPIHYHHHATHICWHLDTPQLAAYTQELLSYLLSSYQEILIHFLSIICVLLLPPFFIPIDTIYSSQKSCIAFQMSANIF